MRGSIFVSNCPATNSLFNYSCPALAIIRFKVPDSRRTTKCEAGALTLEQDSRSGVFTHRVQRNHEQRLELLLRRHLDIKGFVESAQEGFEISNN